MPKMIFTWKHFLATAFLLIAIALIIFFFFVPPKPNITVPTNVFFGSQGACVGCGVCKATSPGKNGKDTGTAVSFIVNPQNPNVLILSFNLQSLLQNQPSQQQYFTPQATSYPFSVAFSLNDQMFSQLNFPPNTWVLPTSPNHMVINNGVVTDSITVSQANSVTANVIFGNNQGTDPVICNPELPGICSASSQPQGSSIPVSFTVLPSAPGIIQMSFSLLALRQNQLAQVQFFNQTTIAAGGYKFTSPFQFNAPANQQIFVPLQLQGPNPNIPAQSPNQVIINGDAVTVVINYSQNIVAGN